MAQEDVNAKISVLLSKLSKGQRIKGKFIAAEEEKKKGKGNSAQQK
jgi:hypothetical protein